MRLTVVSSKECWRDPSGRVVTVGGFPRQMRGLATLFDAVEVLLPLEPGPPPPGAEPIAAANLTVTPLPRIPGRGPARKLGLLAWLLRHPLRLLSALSRAEAVHTPIPGDVGTVAMLFALALRKPLLVRHCGTWSNRTTLADRFLAALLPRIARGRTVVLATGWAERPPAATPNASWIFSTSLTAEELDRLEPAPPWDGGGTLELVSVGRLTTGKNIVAIVDALPRLLEQIDCRLTVVGDGPERAALERRRDELGLGERLVLRGNLDHAEVLATLGRSHLLVFPSRVAEGFPKAVLEAMACGLPVVATATSAVPHLLAPGSDAACGVVLSSSEADAVAEAVLDLAARPADLGAMGRRAARRARAFTLERWTREIEARIVPAWPAWSRAEGRPAHPEGV